MAQIVVPPIEEPPDDGAPAFDYTDEPRANGHAHVNGSGKPAAVTRTDKAPAPRELSGINFADMKPHLSDGYGIKGLFFPNSTVEIFGPSGCGKTFFATDIALHWAAGRSWRGLRVNGGLVVYGGLEGAVSAENRFVARVGEFPANIPLKLVPGPINLRNPADVVMLTDLIREAEAEHGVKVVAVFIDTLSRAMAGGDENSSEDMGALIAGIDSVRLATGATLVLIHHSGKDESRGARGHSSLKAALDTEIEVSKKGNVHVATVTKQRDLPSGGQFAFSLQVVELGHDSDGDAITTCIVKPADTPPTDRKLPAGKNQQALLAAIQEWQRVHEGQTHISSVEFRSIAKAQGIAVKRLPEIADSLAKCGWLISAVGGYTLSSEDS